MSTSLPSNICIMWCALMKFESNLQIWFFLALKVTYQRYLHRFTGVKVQTVHVALVRQILKAPSSIQAVAVNRSASFWITSHAACGRCPSVETRLKPGGNYLLMGYEDVRRRRLLFDSRCIAWKWKNKWIKNIEVS